MSLPQGATIPADDMKRIQDALDALTPGSKTYDPHNPRSLSVTVNLFVPVEFPKLLHKGSGEKRSHFKVHDAAQEASAREKGWGDFVPDQPEEA